jgi:hypothetical protein
VRITDGKILDGLHLKNQEFRALQNSGKLSPGAGNDNGDDGLPKPGAELTPDSDLSGLQGDGGDASFDFGPPESKGSEPDDLEKEIDGDGDKGDYVDI